MKIGVVASSQESFEDYAYRHRGKNKKFVILLRPADALEECLDGVEIADKGDYNWQDTYECAKTVVSET